MTLSWVVTAQILVYTSLKTCRMTSPHLWWLLFGIICIMYLMVLEILILGIMVLIIAPILFVSLLDSYESALIYRLTKFPGVLEHLPNLHRPPPTSESRYQTRDRQITKVHRRAHTTCHVHPSSSR